ncbi:NUDIX domain-containing protein [Aneurinibacillus aneurinilyticus]|nr:NUDIX domain-containing protein [Aneurinibacillus aneurinilyticus]MCI1696523.1 NUDIX hydrolase [Aneurinibacillus aneurinilyticus]MED0671673.1 NUDIX domain-containing protein [Aneurinibacillus aneurinilyticus]MED0709491.1 NUDIX domain-containing protein [Aneurinibacillus aneurinilyticus]MED0726353.1 NUDIX domain-containing protein [Aneurinibacillus aneurinilyticus]MED0731606.1 NUDIX domain-containing protein [Aneurinibacillus aneurinilyticus]
MGRYETEADMLAHYDSKQYQTPDGYTSDIAVFSIIAEELPEHTKKPPKRTLKIMLIKRAACDNEGNANIEGGKWALPGGFIQPNETAYEAAKRELQEEAGVSGLHLKHFNVYDRPGRDPRGWIISNAHYAIVPEYQLDKRKAADDAAEVELFDIEEAFALELAFDHRQIIQEALAFIRRDMIQTTVARNFLPQEFTLSELQGVLLAVVSEPAIQSSPVFFEKAPKLRFIELVTGDEGKPKTSNRYSYRPAKLYRFNEVEPVFNVYK